MVERESPDAETVAQELEIERQRLQQAKLNALSDTWIRERQDQLRQAGQLDVNVDLGRRS